MDFSNSNWIKGNCDRVFLHDSQKAGSGGLFRDHKCEFIVVFYEPLPLYSSFLSKFYVVLKAIEIVSHLNYQNLWLELDSLLMVKAFDLVSHVPWELKSRWEACRLYTFFISILLSHIYWEGNNCAKSFSNLGLTFNSLCLVHSIPLSIISDYVKDSLGLLFYRLSF